MISVAAFEAVIDDSGVAGRMEAILPIGVRARQLTVRTPAGRHMPDPGRQPARPPDQGAPGPDRASPAGPAAARRDRGLEAGPAPAALPADRAAIPPGCGRTRPNQTRRTARRPAART